MARQAGRRSLRNVRLENGSRSYVAHLHQALRPCSASQPPPRLPALLSFWDQGASLAPLIGPYARYFICTQRDRSNWLISWITLQSDGSDERNLQALLESYRLLSEFTTVLNVLEGGSPLGAGFHGGLRHHGGL